MTTKIPKFLTNAKGIWLFLCATMLFAVIFVLVYQPAGYMKTTEALAHWNKHLYTVIQFLAGSAILATSRFIFLHFYRRHSLVFRDLVLWVVAEFVVISLALTMIAWFLNAAPELDLNDLLRRVSFNIASIIVIPYSLTYLAFTLLERKHQIEALNDIIDKRHTAAVESTENLNFYDRGGKLAFSTRRVNVLYIEAADNYSNIHYINEEKEDTFILHNSLKNIDNPELYQGLLRCHRSYMVNTDNVKLLRKEKDGLLIELSQGARPIPVSRTYNDNVVRFFAGSASV